MKILVADDDADIRRVVRLQLLKAGYEVVVATDGQEACDILQKPDAPPIIILDRNMPRMDGLEVCRRLRAGAARDQHYVIMLTARSESEDRLAGLDAGVDDYLTKPASQAEFLARVRIAVRIVSYQARLQQKIESLQELLRRHHLLTDLYYRSASEQPGAAPEQVEAAENPAAASASADPIATLRTLRDSSKLIARTLSDLGLAGVNAVEPARMPAAFTPDLVAWSALALPSESAWLDLKLELDTATARVIHRILLHSTAPESEAIGDLLAEVVNVLQRAFVVSLRAENIPAFAPALARPVSPQRFSKKDESPLEAARCAFEFRGNFLRVSLLKTAAPVLSKFVRDVKVADVLTQPVYFPESRDMVLIKEGMMLNSRYVEKLMELNSMSSRPLTVSVIEPSAISRALHAE